ncbi:coiled-coil domain-containing protein 106-like [Pygocentrus nattereri]|uniref:coiled-coil domain-containing protein 106-like n=1 Tax=Pygocentrus nattereri TaxID=42514 RepID=UPI00189197DD|nr:coiled-coil domain-containing protein 106-like [Pygocentrus nattereri]
MSPVAKALDVLQGETSVQMGWLVPTITLLRTKLQQLNIASKFCEPLIAALLSGLEKRFGEMLTDPELIAAAILVPKFKTCWTSDENILKLGLDYIRSHLDCQAENHISEGSQSSEEEDFFSSLKKTSPLETTQQLDAYLGCPRDTAEIWYSVSLQETIKHLQPDKEFLKDQLSRMTASSSSHSRSSSISGSSTGTPKGKGKKAIETEEEESRDEIAVLSTESSTIDDSDDEEMKPPSNGKKARSTKQDDLDRTRAKTVAIIHYKRAVHAFNQGGSMKKAFQKVGVHRNTISRTSPIPELAIAAPGVFQAL